MHVCVHMCVCVCVSGAEIGQGEYGSVLKGTLTEYKGKKGKVRLTGNSLRASRTYSRHLSISSCFGMPFYMCVFLRRDAIRAGF